MPRGAEARLRGVHAGLGHARRARLGRRAGGTCRARSATRWAPSSGRRPGSVVMHQNVSVCQSVILSCFDLGGRRNGIVYEELNFPSVMYVYEAHRALGARIVTVKSDDGMTVPLDRFLRAIDETTLLVPLSHVIFKSGAVQDVAAIVRRAHEVGALVVADLYQSAGTVPVDVSAWDVDFATGGSVKWLCGGPGRGIPVRGAAPARAAAAPGHGLARARAAVRLRAGRGGLRRRRRALPARHARRARRCTRRRPATRWWRRSEWTPSAASRCARPQLLLDLARAPGSPRARRTARSSAAAWPSSTSRTARRSRASCCAARSGGPPARRRHPPLAALLHHGRRDPPRRPGDPRHPGRRCLARARTRRRRPVSERVVAPQPQPWLR